MTDPSSRVTSRFRFRFLSLAACLAACLPLAACGGDDTSGATGAKSAMQKALVAAGSPAGVKLDKSSMRNYLSAMDELMQAGLEYGQQKGDKSSKMADMGSAWKWNSDMNDVLDDHGFDQASFMAVHTRVAMSFAAVMMEQQMEQAKAEMPPEQYEMMKSMMGAQGALPGVTDADKALVSSMLAEIEKVYRINE